MATPTNLVELADLRLAGATAAKAAAQTSLQQAQTDLAAAGTALDIAKATYAQKEKHAAEVRAQLAAIATPADGEPLLVDLEQTIIELRAATGAILAAEGAAGKARGRMEEGRSRLQQAEGAIAAAKDEQTREQAARARRETAKSALTQPPLGDLAARATALLASQTFDDAKQRVDADFPQKLRERARERAQLAAARLERTLDAAHDAQQLMDDEATAVGGAQEQALAPARALEQSASLLFDFATRAVARCDAAEAALVRIGGPDNPPLSQQQKDRIGDAALQAAREAAADAESELDQARELASQKQAAFDLERLKVAAATGEAGVTAALADATSDLAKAKAELDAALGAVPGKETAYTAAMRKSMDAWEAAVPDSAWRDLTEFDAASATLTALSVSPAALATAVTNAEGALLAARLTLDEGARSLSTLQAGLALAAASAAVAEQAAARLAFSALRGD
jgi:hypothetical protein